MAQRKRQDTNTGNGLTKTPILANENAPMEANSKLSPMPTSIGEGSTKPLSVAEALSLLQTICLDLRSLGCEVSILARGHMLYLITKTPASIGDLAIKDGHIQIQGVPVSVMSEVRESENV